MAIIDDYEPRPGDFFLAKSDGFRGFVFRMAQVLTGEPSEYSHAGIVLDNRLYIEARPGGAALEPLDKLWSRRALAFSQNDLTDDERWRIVEIARTFIDTPYSWLHFAVLAGKTIHVNTSRLEQRVLNHGGMICSALVDEIYTRAGVHLFSDGRAPGDVSPGSLAHVGRLYHCRREPRVQRALPPSPPQTA
jgi:cell wall-associated NlpC family hydrolase